MLSVFEARCSISATKKYFNNNKQKPKEHEPMLRRQLMALQSNI